MARKRPGRKGLTRARCGEKAAIRVLNLGETALADGAGGSGAKSAVGVNKEDDVRLTGNAVGKVGPPRVTGGKSLTGVGGVCNDDGTQESTCSDADNEHSG